MANGDRIAGRNIVLEAMKARLAEKAAREQSNGTPESAAVEPTPANEPTTPSPETPATQRRVEAPASNITPPNPGSQRQQSRSALNAAIQTALHGGMQAIKEKGTLGLELTRQIESMKSTIDARIVKIFSIMDVAAVRTLNGDAYFFDTEVRVVNNPDFNVQLKETMRTAGEFAKIVEVLPQEIVTLVTELNDAESALSAVMRREPIPSPTTPPQIDPWNPSQAPHSTSQETFRHTVPEIPNQPAFEHGARETERVFGIAAEMMDAIKNLKLRVDTQTIRILNTINEASTRALNGEAFADKNGTIVAVTDEPSLEKRLQATIHTAHDLIEIMQRLPIEIQELISEIRDAEKKFFSVLGK